MQKITRKQKLALGIVLGMLVVAGGFVLFGNWEARKMELQYRYRKWKSPSKMDFSLPLRPIKQTGLKFSSFQGRPAFLFYFSVNCGHCRKLFPRIKKMRDTYQAKGLDFVAICNGASSPEDISAFDQEIGIDLPAFQDVTKKFTHTFGTGSTPIVYLVETDGKYEMWNDFHPETYDMIEQKIQAKLEVK